MLFNDPLSQQLLRQTGSRFGQGHACPVSQPVHESKHGVDHHHIVSFLFGHTRIQHRLHRVRRHHARRARQLYAEVHDRAILPIEILHIGVELFQERINISAGMPLASESPESADVIEEALIRPDPFRTQKLCV